MKKALFFLILSLLAGNFVNVQLYCIKDIIYSLAEL
jgi:hypothetical protein